MPRRALCLMLAPLLAILAAVSLSPIPPQRIRAPLIHEAYIWQREWTADVRGSVAEQEANFSRVVVLGAEVTWKGEAASVAWPHLDYACLRAAHAKIGLALRIGVYRGAFGADSAEYIAGIARELLERSRRENLTVDELQLDFDCAESKLAEYRGWIEAVKARVAPVAVTFTALPCWLNRREFAQLAQAVPEFVLQVHALQRPALSGTDVTLCDATQARVWAEQAAEFGVPFRVALPTYAYCVAFDVSGKFKGLSAEGPAASWPEYFTTKTLSANPREMAALVKLWRGDRPELLRGIIWYRMPVSGDRMNWTWATLDAVMHGNAPSSRLEAEAVLVEPGLYDIYLNANGAQRDVTIRIQGSERCLGAVDALSSFSVQKQSGSGCELTGKVPLNGARQKIGWIRVAAGSEISVDVVSP